MNCKYLWMSGVKPDKGESRLVAGNHWGMKKTPQNLQRISDQFRLNPGDEKLRIGDDCSTMAARRSPRWKDWVLRVDGDGRGQGGCGGRGAARTFVDKSDDR
jgi:hypothetical protein